MLVWTTTFDVANALKSTDFLTVNDWRLQNLLFTTDLPAITDWRLQPCDNLYA